MSTTTITTLTEPKLEKIEPVKDLKPETKVIGNQESFYDQVHFLGDKEGKVVIRSPPRFDNIEQQRTYQKQHLAVAFRVFARQGFDEGVAGHICKLFRLYSTAQSDS
jgi:hypothetical protein